MQLISCDVSFDSGLGSPVVHCSKSGPCMSALGR